MYFNVTIIFFIYCPLICPIYVTLIVTIHILNCNEPIASMLYKKSD